MKIHNRSVRTALSLLVCCTAFGPLTSCGAIDTSGLEDGELTYRKVADVSGVVIDSKTQEPVFAAQVRVQNETQVTDQTGAFFISGVNAGGQMITVSHPDYLPFSQAVELAAGSNAIGALQLVPRNCVPDCTSCGADNGCGSPCNCAPVSVVSTSPIEGSATVSAASPILIDFDAAIDLGSGTIEVTPSVTGLSRSLVGTTQVRLLHDDFALGTSYTVRVSGFTAAGRLPLAPFALHFSTSTCTPSCAPTLTACGSSDGCNGTCPCEQLQVAATQPSDGATGISPTAPVVVTFDAPVQRSSCAVEVTPSLTGITKSWVSDYQLSIGHDAFAAGTSYTIALSDCTAPGVLPLADADFGFTTAVAGSTLVVSTVVPASGAVDVPKTAAIELTFSGAVTNPGGGTITVKPEVAEVTLAWSQGGTKLTLGHAALAEYTTYEVKVGGFTAEGMAPLADYAIVFTTGGCVPACGGRTCGSDGCNGSCGNCDVPPADTCEGAVHVSYVGAGICQPAGVCDFSAGRNEENCGASGKTCDTETFECVSADPCQGVTCQQNATCKVQGGQGICACNASYVPVGETCVLDVLPDWCSIQWYGNKGTPGINVEVGTTGPSTAVYGHLRVSALTPTTSAPATHRAELGVMTGTPAYPIVPGDYEWIPATYNTTCTTCQTDDEWVAEVPTDKAGTFNFIFRVSVNNGGSWLYCQGPTTKGPITGAPVQYGSATVTGTACGATWCNAQQQCDNGSCVSKREAFCTAADCGAGQSCLEVAHEAGDFVFCDATTSDSYTVTIRYFGAGDINLATSDTRLNGAAVDLSSTFNAATKTFVISRTGLTASKYSYLLRLKTTTGADLEPLLVPMWIGAGMRYAGFTWYDATMYQVLTDRFYDAIPGNNVNNGSGTLAEVTDPRVQWQGGDFAGITAKLDHLADMGITAIWMSSPILSSHNSQPGVSLTDTRRYSSFHGYHPIATGYTHLNHYGYANPIEPAYGTPAELHTLVNEAHKRGIRVLPDFVVNHVQQEASLYSQHPDWFFSYYPCDGHWSDHRVDCWFTTALPDFNYGAKPQAVSAVVDHAIWMAQEFDFDGFRVYALRHMDDAMIRALKQAVVTRLETTVSNHDMPLEPTVFYMIDESFSGWARYHVRPDMVQGQTDAGYHDIVTSALLRYTDSLATLASFAVANDTAYRTTQSISIEGVSGFGGYAGAIMGNYFGNVDTVRALTEAGGSHARLRLAQAFLMTSPGNMPVLYQGDDIGTLGGADPDNRTMQRFTGLSDEEGASLANARALGQLREQHAALRRGVRSTVHVEYLYWIYKVSYQGEDVYVAINRDADQSYSTLVPSGYVDALGNCSGGVVPSEKACVFVK